MQHMEAFIGILFLFLFFAGVAFIGNATKSKQYTFWPLRYDSRLDEITSRERGTQSEHKLISTLLDYGIPPKAIFHDLYIKNGRYGYSQIDVAVATRVGIIVFEVKDYSGWIFGRGHQNQWVQVLNYGKNKFRFYNPVLQNEAHIKVLKRQSEQLNDLPIYSVIVFYGDCQLRDISFIPNGTFVTKAYRISDVLDTIFENDDVEYTDKYEIMNILQTAVNNGSNEETQTKHIEKVKDMLGTDRVFE